VVVAGSLRWGVARRRGKDFEFPGVFLRVMTPGPLKHSYFLSRPRITSTEPAKSAIAEYPVAGSISGTVTAASKGLQVSSERANSRRIIPPINYKPPDIPISC
jgi:hypothetical protein